MKILLVAEQREGKLLGSVSDLLGFAQKLGAESVMFLVGSETDIPKFNGTLYLADVAACGECARYRHIPAAQVARNDAAYVKVIVRARCWHVCAVADDDVARPVRERVANLRTDAHVVVAERHMQERVLTQERVEVAE